MKPNVKPPRAQTGAFVSRRRLDAEALRISREISTKYVTEPSHDELQADALIALKRFNHAVRIKFHARERERENLKSKNSNNNNNSGVTNVDKGLETGLRPSGGSHTDGTKCGDAICEAFLSELAHELLTYLGKCREKDPRSSNATSTEINSFLNLLRKAEDLVFVETDKTNSRVFKSTDDYAAQVIAHLNNDATKTNPGQLQKAKEEAESMLEKFKSMLSSAEHNYISETIRSSRVPTPRLLVKDHKDKDKDGNFPTRLVVPATNFTAGFPHVGMKGIRKIFDKHKVNYTRYNIVQASEMKIELDELKIKEAQHGVTSIDAEKMYPSIKFAMIKKATEYFMKDVPKEDQDKVLECLEMIKFGMSTTFIQFQEQYWLYGGMTNVELKGLTIGGYESAWLADLVAAYIFENSKDLFSNAIYIGTYRDDGLRITEEKESTDDICDWLELFQSRVNELCGSDHLKFPVEIWNPDASDSEIPRNKKVKINRKSAFPYLDTEMYWHEENMAFKVHRKENQILKYVNSASTHTSACRKWIPSGVIRRPSILTTLTLENMDMRIDELYPNHAEALKRAGLTTQDLA